MTSSGDSPDYTGTGFPVQGVGHEVITVILKVVVESVCPTLVTIAT